MTMFKAVFAASLVAYAAAECPNACSGHGTCSKYDMCTCYRNWQAADCSQRTCPFNLAHVDSPKGDLNHDNVISDADATPTIVGSTVYPQGTNEQFPQMQDTADTTIDNSAHAYMECSNKGICDRTTGTCECFDGYDGSACQRASCPNDCSGHGTCESISVLANREFANVYALWDKDATMGCKCDSGYGAADCSERSCKYGTDPLYSDDAFGRTYKASYSFTATSTDGLKLTSTYSIVFNDIFGETYETSAITMGADCTAIQAALTALPNDVIATTTCTATNAQSDATVGWTSHSVDLDFDGNPGNLKPIVINEYLDGDRKTVVSTDTSGTAYTLNQWTRQLGENTDHFATQCSGVTVTPTLSRKSQDSGNADYNTWDDKTLETAYLPEPGSIGYLATSQAALLYVCLGDSDGDSANNVDVYNWDHGAIQKNTGDAWATPEATLYTMGSYPHAIKVQNTAGDSEYLLTWYNQGTASATHRMRIGNMASLTGSLDVYTTSGVVQMLGKDNAHGGGNGDNIFTTLVNETKLTGYFDRYSNKVYTNFDGSCETTGAYYSNLHNCIEKGDLLFVVDGCWGAGMNPGASAEVTDVFGGGVINCAAPNDVNTGNGMLYTVNKIYTKAWSANTTAFDSSGGPGNKGQEDRFVIELDHNLIWDGSEIGNPDQSIAALPDTDTWGAGFTGLVVLFKFTPATDGSSYTYVSECSNRGSCDRETGLCSCFKGYTSDDCSMQNSLSV